jgi:hypothetical protein
VGVEGVDAAVIESAIRKCVSGAPEAGRAAPELPPVTAADFFEDGLMGSPGARERRAGLLRRAGLPSRLSTKEALGLLSRLCGYEGYKKLLRQLDGSDSG